MPLVDGLVIIILSIRDWEKNVSGFEIDKVSTLPIILHTLPITLHKLKTTAHLHLYVQIEKNYSSCLSIPIDH